MSMKRVKQRTFGSGKDDENDPWAKPKVADPTWEQATEGKADDAFTAYAMTAKFAKGQLLHHVKFGKGLVLDTTGTSVEVLFQDGKKKLGHAG
jgi:hypothetical protein